MRNRALLILPTLILACSGETASDTRGALTQPGTEVLAAEGVAFARAVNRPVRTLVTALRLITAFPPTRFAAREQELVWGQPLVRPPPHDAGANHEARSATTACASRLSGAGGSV